MPTIGTSSKPAYVYDAGTDTWIPIGPGEHTHAYVEKSTLTTTGDLVYASAANTPERLGIGSTGQVLTVSGGVPAWAAAGGGAYTSLTSGSLNGTASLTLTFSLTGYLGARLLISGGASPSSGGLTAVYVRLNNVSTADYYRYIRFYNSAATTLQSQAVQGTNAEVIPNVKQGGEPFRVVMDISGDQWQSYGRSYDSNNNQMVTTTFGRLLDLGGALTSIVILSETGQNFTGGTATVYGVK